MTDTQFITLKKERGRLLDAWRNAGYYKKELNSNAYYRY